MAGHEIIACMAYATSATICCLMDLAFSLAASWTIGVDCWNSNSPLSCYSGTSEGLRQGCQMLLQHSRARNV